MAKTPKLVYFLRFLIAFLLLVILLFGLVTYYIQNKSRQQIVEASQILHEKDQPLEILDLCIQQIYRIDNDFRLYTLSYSRESFNEYKRQLNIMDSLTMALKESFIARSKHENSITSLQSGTKEKEAMLAGFGKLRRLADSLLNTANSLESFAESNIKKQTVTEIQKYTPDLSGLVSPTSYTADTVDLKIEQQKKKKGLFAKIKTFFVGEKETNNVHKQITVKAGTPGPVKKAAPQVNITEISREVARQTNQYYENQLKTQYQLNEQIKLKEKALIELNSRLMNSVSGIFKELKHDHQVREEKIHTLAVVNILKNSKIIELCVLVSIALGFFLSILIALNLSRIIKYQKGIVAAREKAENEASEKSKFLAFMSHELRTPLTSIIGFAEQMKETNLSQDQQKYIQAMTGSSDVLLTTVNDILDLSKLDSGKFRFVTYSFLVKSVFEQVVNSLRPLAAKKGLSIELVEKTGDTLCLLGDEMRLKQVLINLVNNAIKYSEKGIITVSISADSPKGRCKLQVDISDQGIGIDEDKLSEVFSEFSQVHEQSSKKWIIGTGLGLPICKKIVEQQNGKIWVKSIKGEGSTFSFMIPYKAVIGKPEEPVQSETQFDPLAFKDKSILVVDDTEINLVLLDSIFKKWGVSVDKARDGAEAFALFKSNDYDLILSDVYMPNMDGLELTRQIRHSFPPLRKNVPIIVLSANLIQDEIEKFRLTGVSDYMMKPFHAADLYKTVSRHLKV